MWSTVDKWLGRTMFHPPVVKLCQMLDWKLGQFYRCAFAFGFSLQTIWAFQQSVGTGFITSLFACFYIFRASTVPAFVREPNVPWLRAGWWILVVFWLFSGHPLVPLITITIFLFAEYSTMLNNIPPREGKRYGFWQEVQYV